MVFKYVDGSHYSEKKFPAQMVGEHLTRIRDSHGQLTPQVVLKDAASKKSPIRPMFEWDDKIAGHKYRRIQAQHLIKSIAEVTVTQDEGGHEKTIETRAFVCVIESKERVYKPIQVVLRDEADRAYLLRQAAAELAAFKKKYAVLLELSSALGRHIDMAIEEIDRVSEPQLIEASA